jgi:hypothetical protein
MNIKVVIALIPTAFGGVLLLTGALARRQHLSWRAAVGTTAVAMIGCLSTIVSLMTYSEASAQLPWLQK